MKLLAGSDSEAQHKEAGNNHLHVHNMKQEGSGPKEENDNLPMKAHAELQEDVHISKQVGKHRRQPRKEHGGQQLKRRMGE